MHVDLVRELKAALSARLVRSAEPATGTARIVGDTVWAPPALGLAPVRPGQARLAIRLAAKEDAEVLLAGMADAVLDEVDVRVVGAVRVLAAPLPRDLRRRTRPLAPGLSVAHPAVTAGTLGGFVRVGGRVALLSNGHVLAAGGAAAVGDPVLQPGPADGGNPAVDRVATLAAVAPLTADRPDRVDAAVAVVDPEVLLDPGRFPGGPLGAVLLAADDVEPDGRVEKVGRTTGHTVGRISAVELDGVSVRYDRGVHVFDGQIEVDGGPGPFSAGGDSGSVIWRSADRAPLGLLFAGSETGGRTGGGLTFANPLPTVLSVLGAQWIAG